MHTRVSQSVRMGKFIREVRNDIEKINTTRRGYYDKHKAHARTDNWMIAHARIRNATVSQR